MREGVTRMIPSAHTEQSPTAVRLQAEYRARRERLWLGRPKTRPANQNTLLVSPEPELPRPEWVTSEISFDDHVKRHQAHLAKASHPMRTFACERTEAFGYTFDQITEDGARKGIALARQSVIFDTAVKFPEAGTSELGRLFKRDHATIRYSMKKEAARRGVGIPETRKVHVRDRDGIIADIKAGLLTHMQIADKHGVERSTITRISKEAGLANNRGGYKKPYDEAQIRHEIASGVKLIDISIKHDIAPKRLYTLRKAWGLI